jgi:glycosyl transferase, family 25
MRVYYINLDRHPERRAHMEALLAGLDAQRVPAIDAQSWPQTEKGLTRFEIACLRSHRAAWRLFLDSGADFACFLEDDVHMSPDFAALVARQDWIPADADAVKLDTFFNPVMLDKHAREVAGRRLALLHTRHESCAGYVLSRKGAETFLRATEDPSLPVDYIVFPENPRGKGLHLYQLAPAVLIQDSLYLKHYGEGRRFASSIQQVETARKSRKSLLARARREALRLHAQMFKARNFLRDRFLKGLKPEIVPFR